MDRILTNEAVKAITTISKMYPKRDFQVRIEDNSIKMHWLDSQPTQVKASQGHKIQRKLNQVREILGDKFIEFYWSGDRQMVYARF